MIKVKQSIPGLDGFGMVRHIHGWRLSTLRPRCIHLELNGGGIFVPTLRAFFMFRPAQIVAASLTVIRPKLPVMSVCQDRGYSDNKKWNPKRHKEVRCSRGFDPAVDDPG